MRTPKTLLTAAILLPLVSCSQDLSYLGQEPPGNTPALFAPGIVATDLSAHSYPAVSPRGDEIYWSAYKTSFREQKIWFVKRDKRSWSEPAVAPFSGEHNDGTPVFSPDGKNLYFSSSRPLEPGGDPGRGYVWVMERSGDGWSKPAPLPATINSGMVSMQVSLAANGNLYFAAWRDDSAGGADIYRSRLVYGEYQTPERLGASINGEHQDIAPYVAPDESYLVFTSLGRPDDTGNGDLYVSFAATGGEWLPAVNMGTPVNTPQLEAFAGVSPDGRYLMFTSERDGRPSVYWTSAEILNSLRGKVVSDTSP